MLAKQNRLKRWSDFTRIAKYGTRRYSSLFILYVYKPKVKHEEPRFGIVISQKTEKKASKRNKLRRWIKSDLYKNIQRFKPYDYMLVVKKQAVDKTHKQITSDLNNLCF